MNTLNNVLAHHFKQYMEKQIFLAMMSYLLLSKGIGVSLASSNTPSVLYENTPICMLQCDCKGKGNA